MAKEAFTLGQASRHNEFGSLNCQGLRKPFFSLFVFLLGFVFSLTVTSVLRDKSGWMLTNDSSSNGRMLVLSVRTEYLGGEITLSTSMPKRVLRGQSGISNNGMKSETTCPNFGNSPTTTARIFEDPFAWFPRQTNRFALDRDSQLANRGFLDCIEHPPKQV